jgi:predicted restriction endonuclease
MKSFSNLNAAVKYGKIDEDLFNFLSKKKDREISEQAILKKYFPETMFLKDKFRYYIKILARFRACKSIRQ